MLFGRNKKTLTYTLSEPLDDASAMAVDLHVGTGNLTMDSLEGNKQLLVNGELQYLDEKDIPTHTLTKKGGEANLTVKARGALRSGLRFPWDACNGATDWRIHFNPSVAAEITARSGGGNITADLSGMTITGIMAETGGGNVSLTLPDNTKNLVAEAKTGGGNVTIEIGKGMSGKNTLVAGSGAGNVEVKVPKDIGQVVVDKKVECHGGSASATAESHVEVVTF